MSAFPSHVGCWGSTTATYSLAQRPALANGHLVTVLDTEGGGDVGGEVLVALLVTGVLGDEVEVFAADDDRPVHLGRHDGAGEDTAADRDLAGEGALLVCEVSVRACPWGSPSSRFRPGSFRSPMSLVSVGGVDRSGVWGVAAAEALLSTICTYRCTGPQWRRSGCGNPDRRPCTISGHPCPGGRT